MTEAFFFDRKDYEAPLDQEQEILLSLEATLGRESRSLSFDQGNPLTPTVAEEGVEVLCIVRSDDPADQPIYRTITWEKDPNVPNRIYLRNYRLRLLPGMQLAGKRWYVMGLIGGEWDESSQQLRLSTNAISTTDASSPVSLNVPAISSWVELPTSAISDPQVYRYTLVPFQAQGALIQHKIESNKTDHDMSISSFKVVSTAFCFGGHYDLSPASLPAVGATTGHKLQDLLRFTPSPEELSKEYVHTHGTVPEYSHEFPLPKAIEVKAQSAGKDNEIATFWVMPTKIAKSELRTNIFVRATPQGVQAPSTMRLPSYGKHHKSHLTNASAITLKSNLIRPKLAIEYMAEYNVARNTNPTAWTTVGEQRPFGSTARFATSHGFEAVTGSQWSDAKNHGIAGYHLPTVEEWLGVVPMSASDDKLRLNFKAAGTPGSAPGTQAPTNVLVKVGNTSNRVDFQIKNTPEVKTSYAIHFTEDAEGNKRRVAYRYRSIPNPEYLSLLHTSTKGVAITVSGLLREPTPTEISQSPNISLADRVELVDYLEIQAVYLGPHFLGSIEDIATPEWWSNADRNRDVVTRYLSGGGKEFPWFVVAEKPGATVLQTFYPFTMHYWLDTPVKNTTLLGDQVVSQYEYFFYTPYGGTTNKVLRPALTGGFVRLFSDQ